MEESSSSDVSDTETNADDQPNVDSDDDEPVYWREKLGLFFRYHWRGFISVVTPILLIPLLLPLPGEKYQWCGYTLCLMAVYWVTECIPQPVTSFVPVLIFPLTDVMDTATTCKCYMNDTIIMFLGSLMLAAAVEQSGLHKRVALSAMRTIGYSHYKLLFTMSFITMFVSMWILNTAATTMMVPIIFALLRVFENQGLLNIYNTNQHGDLEASDLTTCYFCAASFSATIGGIGTLVGTATNMVFKGLFHSQYRTAPEYLSFPKFSAFSIPYMLVLELCLYLFLIIKYFGFLRPNSKEAKATKIPPDAMEAAKLEVEIEWKKLGRISFWEIMVLILFGGAILMFFCRSPQDAFTGWGDAINDYFGNDRKFISDSALAMVVCFCMLLLPATLEFFDNFTAKYHKDLPRGTVKAVLDCKTADDSLPYSFIFLLGGGFALSTAAKPEYSDLNSRLGTMLAGLELLPNLLIILIVITFTIIITNIASNVAVANVVVPIAMTLAKEVNQNPLVYNIAAGFSASHCFCLPVGTPGNLIVQGAAKIPTKKMIIAGLIPSLFTIVITWLAVAFWAPIIWPDITTMPDWISDS